MRNTNKKYQSHRKLKKKIFSNEKFQKDMKSKTPLETSVRKLKKISNPELSMDQKIKKNEKKTRNKEICITLYVINTCVFVDNDLQH